MSVTYNGLHVDERYSAILEPNLYFNPILVPGVTCTDKYETGPAGQIFVHQLNTSAVEAGTPGRDFTDEVAADTLIPIQINNNFQKSKKIYGVQAAAVSFAAGNEYLATAIQECREGWMQCGIACLAQEGKAATATAAITEDTVKSDLIDTRTEIVKDKGRANVVMCTPEYYGLVLKAAGKDFTPSTNDRITADEGYDALSQVTVEAIPAEYADVSGVTAAAGDVLANKVFVGADGAEAAGTMPNNGAVQASIDGLTQTEYTVPAGYHTGTGKVSLTGDIEEALAAI